MVEFGDDNNPCSCSCPSFRRNRMLCKHFFAVIAAGEEQFSGLSKIFRHHPINTIDDEIFHQTLTKRPSQNNETEIQYMYEQSDTLEDEITHTDNPTSSSSTNLSRIPERGVSKKMKSLLCSNVKVLLELCHSIDNDDVLLVQEMMTKW